jgi:hypothetical protein
MYGVAAALHDEFEKTDVVALLKQLRDSLQNQVSNPGQPAYQQQVSDTLQKLDAILGAAASNNLSPAWELAADEIGALALMGSRLKSRVTEVFSRNQITPSIAHKEVAQIVENVQGLESALAEFVSSCEKLGVKIESLEAGECELGLLLPRELVKNKLEGFAKELERINRTLGPFSELATGSRPGYDIRSVSSSDLTVFLSLVPKVAACLAVAIERVVELYKTLLEIRELREKMSAQGVPMQALQQIDSHANGVMSTGIETLVNELLNQYAAANEAGRTNELRKELTSALNLLANRLDRGVRIEIRVEPMKEGSRESSEEEAAARSAIQTALSASRQIQFLRPVGAPILSLPDAQSPESPGAAESS